MSAEEPTGGAAREPTEEELRQAFEEQMRKIRVEDVLVQTVVTLVNLAGRRLGLGMSPEQQAEEKDVEQAHQAIEAVRALLPILPQEPLGPVRDALSQLQVAYAQEVRGESGETPAEGAEQPEGDAERAKARSKLWTPPGT